MIGTVQANEKGFGFFIPEDGSTDAFLPPKEMNGILNGDKIKAKVFKDPRKEDRFAAEFISIVKRAHTSIVGLFVKEGGKGYLKPDDNRIRSMVQLGASDLKPSEGQKIVALITRWPGPDGRMEGKLEEILGHPDDPGVDIRSIIRKHNWPERFPAIVEAQTEGFPENPSEKDWEGRLDLRKLPILTIDGPDAKDFDDAISLEKTPSGRYRLGVHIADVSHYVHDDMPLDKEAQARATSLYLADRVLPMLPHNLSDGLCSLREGVPRLTVSAFLEYSSEGHLARTHFALSVIQSSRRGTYGEVQQVLDGTANEEVKQKYAHLEPMLKEMLLLSRHIRRNREAHGSLDFDFPEVKAIVGMDGLVKEVKVTEKLETHKLIEDFMVAANEAVASHLSRLKIPSLYRIHEPPSDSDLDDLVKFLQIYKIPFKNFDLTTPLGLRSLLKSVQGHKLEPVISTLSLRSLKLAVYSTENLGHFGLALKSYCHFTSPIRRYPDLVVHRSLKKALKAPGHSAHSNYGKLAVHCSTQERSAEKAERECQKVMQLRFMEKRIGEDFSGLVRHITAYGVYVELIPTGIEGFIPIENLTDDLYQFDPPSLSMKGKRGAHVQYGDILKVNVHSVDRVFQRLILTRIYG
jgi:ribonuclease R